MNPQPGNATKNWQKTGGGNGKSQLPTAEVWPAKTFAGRFCLAAFLFCQC
jgi:hypothetical protein